MNLPVEWNVASFLFFTAHLYWKAHVYDSKRERAAVRSFWFTVLSRFYPCVSAWCRVFSFLQDLGQAVAEFWNYLKLFSEILYTGLWCPQFIRAYIPIMSIWFLDQGWDGKASKVHLMMTYYGVLKTPCVSLPKSWITGDILKLVPPWGSRRKVCWTCLMAKAFMPNMSLLTCLAMISKMMTWMMADASDSQIFFLGNMTLTAHRKEDIFSGPLLIMQQHTVQRPWAKQPTFVSPWWCLFDRPCLPGLCVFAHGFPKRSGWPNS